MRLILRSETYRRSSDFYLVSKVEGSRPVMFDLAWRALFILGLLVIGLTTGVIDAARPSCASPRTAQPPGRR